MAAEIKSVLHRFIELYNQDELERLDELVSPDFVDRTAPPGTPADREGWKQGLMMWRSAFPDSHVEIEDEVVEGDRIVTRFKIQGTHQGELMGIPATGKEVSVDAIQIARVADGKIVERWEVADMMSLMTQLGVVEPPGG